MRFGQHATQPFISMPMHRSSYGLAQQATTAFEEADKHLQTLSMPLIQQIDKREGDGQLIDMVLPRNLLDGEDVLLISGTTNFPWRHGRAMGLRLTSWHQ